jgi:hypothetical protein
VTSRVKGLAVQRTVSLFYWEYFCLKLATLLQIVRMSQFPSFEEIEIRLVAKNTYDNWSKTRQTLKRAILGRHPCARTGWQNRSKDFGEWVHSTVICGADLPVHCSTSISKKFLTPALIAQKYSSPPQKYVDS